MDLQIIVLLFFVIVALFCVGVVSLSDHIKPFKRFAFSASIVSLVLWTITLYLSNRSGPFLLLMNHTVYVWPITSITFFILLLDELVKRPITRLRRASNWAVITIAAVTCIVSLTPLNVRGVTPRISNGATAGYSIVPGVLNSAVAGLIIVLLLLLAARFYTLFRVATAVDKIALRIIFRVFLIMATISTITNLLLPIIHQSSNTSNSVALLAASFFVIGISYSLLRHSFLEVRIVILRYLGYVVSLGVIVASLTLLQIAAIDTYTREANKYSTVYRTSMLWLTMGIAIIVFNPLKNLFDKATKRLFFKDAYDPQTFLDELNKVVVANIEIEPLLVKCIDLIIDNIKAEYCTFSLKDRVYSSALGKQEEGHLNEKVTKILHASQLLRSMTVVTVSDVEAQNESLHKILVENGIALLAQLTTEENYSNIPDEGLGYIILGPKRNGNSYTGQDIRIIGIIANELVIALQNALRFEEIENFNATLQEKIDDATRKLRHANDKLRRLNDTKDDFISMASHQLRTPLTSVKGYVSMVLDGDAGNITRVQRKLLTQSFVSAQRMVYLISDLLNVSRLKTGKFIIEPVRCNLARIAHEEVEQLVETAKGRHLELVYNKPEHFPILMMDETKIRQVIMNFLDNAVYYTPAGGRIELKLEDKPQSVELTVTDNGIGVPRHEQMHLFTKFYRAPNAKRARPDGTGLGLFMAKKVIIAQGGAVIFRSHEGKGSTFGFTFPKANLVVQTTNPKA